MKNCDSWDEYVGCYHTFDGECNKTQCQTYNLLIENKELKQKVKTLQNEIRKLKRSARK